MTTSVNIGKSPDTSTFADQSQKKVRRSNRVALRTNLNLKEPSQAKAQTVSQKTYSEIVSGVSRTVPDNGKQRLVEIIKEKSKDFDDLAEQSFKVASVVTHYLEDRSKETQLPEECQQIDSILKEVEKIYTFCNPKGNNRTQKEVKTKHITRAYILKDAGELAEELIEQNKRLSKICLLSVKLDTKDGSKVVKFFNTARRSLDTITTRVNKLETPLTRKLLKLEMLIKKSVPPDLPVEYHQAIAKLFYMSPRDVQRRIDLYTEIHQKRKDLFDELSSKWAYVRVRMEHAKWKKEQIHLNLDVYIALKTFSTRLATLLKSIETTKESFRTRRDETPSEKEESLRKFNADIDDFIVRYKAIAAQIYEFDAVVQKALQSLDSEVNSIKLKEIQDSIEESTPKYHETIEQYVYDEIQTVFSTIKYEQNSLLCDLSAEWKKVKELIDQVLPLEINRFAVTIKERNGSFPYKTTFHSFYGEGKYVQSPFRPLPASNEPEPSPISSSGEAK